MPHVSGRKYRQRPPGERLAGERLAGVDGHRRGTIRSMVTLVGEPPVRPAAPGLELLNVEVSRLSCRSSPGRLQLCSTVLVPSFERPQSGRASRINANKQCRRVVSAPSAHRPNLDIVPWSRSGRDPAPPSGARACWRAEVRSPRPAAAGFCRTVHRPETGSLFGPFRTKKGACPPTRLGGQSHFRRHAADARRKLGPCR